ncbi:MAG: hypothetical protein KBT70_07330 [Roseovarius sp.]|uniref:hypothetical protein n=1 Tax=Roseovarius sp. TaxID=1486281 RepID=UPI001B761B18|nr:hypothetical protein [Roseovarius sp.]MBQ0749998.1 hypothetical protein [Roseovarius sp.]MBQ0808888.1 hypothetical protein [Roseovarius sp.]
MRRGVLITLICLVAGAARAEEPALARYVTDDNVDVYVALFDGQAVELAGCASEGAARALIEMPNARPISDRTQVDLTDSAALGAHPPIPCDPPPLAEAAWPGSMPIWADLAANGRYLLAAPNEAGFYAVDAKCEAIKTALRIRERTQSTGFQGFGQPDPLELRLTINCGPGADAEGPVVTDPASGVEGWTLHSAELFMSEAGLPDTLFVASAPMGEGRGYLPIRRLDGVEIAPIFLEGGARLEAAKAALQVLFAVPAEAIVSPLGFEALEAVQSALFADICTLDCDGYDHAHGFFAVPGIDVALSFEGVEQTPAALDILGRDLSGLRFGDGRALWLQGCSAVAAALGIVPGEGDWKFMVRAAQSGAGQAAAMRCDAARAATCTRVIGPDLPLVPEVFDASGPCAGKTRLVVYLPEAVTATAPLVIDVEQGFAEVEIAPMPGLERAILTVPAGASGAASPCLLSSPRVMIHSRGDLRLTLRDVTLRRRLAEVPQEAIGLHVDGGTLVTDGVIMVADGDAGLPPERGISLCSGEYYARATRVQAGTIAVQGADSRLAISGVPGAPTTLGSARYAISASAGAELVLSDVTLTGRVGASLFNAILDATRLRLVSTDAQSGSSAALQFRGTSEAQLMQSTAQGFACVGTFWTAGSAAIFTLPGNDLTADNTRPSCGAGTIQIFE